MELSTQCCREYGDGAVVHNGAGKDSAEHELLFACLLSAALFNGPLWLRLGTGTFAASVTYCATLLLPVLLLPDRWT